MADPSHTPDSAAGTPQGEQSAPGSPQAEGSGPQERVIRVFLSSTFRDFMSERDRLVRKVFPELRRNARERGVEVVEVDLRWGITEEESRQGKVLPICLAEIRRCRPYFIGMLGDRYGWVPPNDDDNRAVLAEEAWVEEHLGQRSVTEMEILHGVLREPEMAGRAFFYFRDPAWSRRQTEPGFVCDNDEEKEKLADLKQRIRSSRFPLVENLPDPEALADKIGADLWALIEEQFPELDQPDALEREERKHASYRRARTDLYEDGGTGCVKVSQLEQWIATGEQRILITGDSGAGKSALIANWMERHQQQHPEDVFHAHHLGCSNDANALEPMLARMVQAASKLMAEDSDHTLSEPIKIPQDYWELVSTVTDTLSKLSFWCKQQGRRWIWVLDGLDRLPEENQQALPWLPLQLFPHLHVVISALDCPARTILQEREYTTLEIGPLDPTEQRALIQATMRRYNKTLVPELEAKILMHEPARSPLFLRVVLDELRVCGRHETLTQQLEDYLKANSVDALYAKVLARLEGDVGREAVHKVMTALWASRAGLSESELQAITKVKPLQLAQIDLGLEGSLGRNGERLVFDHDYLRQAVKARYLATEEAQRQAYGALAGWFGTQTWNTRKAEEWPWLLMKAQRNDDLRIILTDAKEIMHLLCDRPSAEILRYWRASKREEDPEIDDCLAKTTDEMIKRLQKQPEQFLTMLDRLGDLLEDAGLYRNPLLRVRSLAADLVHMADHGNNKEYCYKLGNLACALHDAGNYSASLQAYQKTLEASEQALGESHAYTLKIIDALASLQAELKNFNASLNLYERLRDPTTNISAAKHPNELVTHNNIALLMHEKGDSAQAEIDLTLILETSERLLGFENPTTLASAENLASIYTEIGSYTKAALLYSRIIKAREQIMGPQHPKTVATLGNRAYLYAEMGDFSLAKSLYEQVAETKKRLLGIEHPSTLTSINNLGALSIDMHEFEHAESLLKTCLTILQKRYGADADATLTAIGNLANLYRAKGDYIQAEDLYKSVVRNKTRLLGNSHPSVLTTIGNLAGLYHELGDFDQAEEMYERCLLETIRLYGESHQSTLICLCNIALLDRDKGNLLNAESKYLMALEEAEVALGQEHPITTNITYELATICLDQGRLEEAESLMNKCLEARERRLGPDHRATLEAIGGLAAIFKEKNDLAQAKPLFLRQLDAYQRLFGNEDNSTLATLEDLAMLLYEQGDPLGASELFEIWLSIKDKEPSADSKLILNTRIVLAKSYSDLDKPEAVVGVLDKAIRDNMSDLDEKLLEVVKWLCDILVTLDRGMQAAELVEEIMQICGDNNLVAWQYLQRLATRLGNKID